MAGKLPAVSSEERRKQEIKSQEFHAEFHAHENFLPMKISCNAELSEFYSSEFLLPPPSAFRPTPFSNLLANLMKIEHNEISQKSDEEQSNGTLAEPARSGLAAISIPSTL
jgi:hypothetical protein